MQILKAVKMKLIQEVIFIFLWRGSGILIYPPSIESSAQIIINPSVSYLNIYTTLVSVSMQWLKPIANDTPP